LQGWQVEEQRTFNFQPSRPKKSAVSLPYAEGFVKEKICPVRVIDSTPFYPYNQLIVFEATNHELQPNQNALPFFVYLYHSWFV
jgi:hypothetical protein